MCRLAHIIVPPENDDDVGGDDGDDDDGEEGGCRGKEDTSHGTNGETAKKTTNVNDVRHDNSESNLLLKSGKEEDCDTADGGNIDHDDDDRHPTTDDDTTDTRPNVAQKETKYNGADGDDDEEEFVCGICLDPLGCNVPIEVPGVVIDEMNDHKTTTTASSSSTTDKSVQRKKFGLLTGCDHVFCIDCLRHWRKEQKKDASELSSLIPGRDDVSSASDRVRACPTCRQVSDFVVPSDKFCVGVEKVQVVGAYKARLSCIPCKRFNGRLGSCPFGRDCFYAHRRSGGQDMKRKDKSKKELWEAKQRRAQNRHVDFLTSLYWLDEEWNAIPSVFGGFNPTPEMFDEDFVLSTLAATTTHRRNGLSDNTNPRRRNRGSRRPDRINQDVLRLVRSLVRTTTLEDAAWDSDSHNASR